MKLIHWSINPPKLTSDPSTWRFLNPPLPAPAPPTPAPGAPDMVTIARATHEHRNQRVADLEAQLATAHARIIDLDQQCAEQLASLDAQDQTIRRAIRDLTASLQENQP